MANGSCTTSDAVTAQFNPSPARTAAQQFYTRLDEEPHYVVLDAGNPGSDFDWSTGRPPDHPAGAYGWFYVEITNDFDLQCDRFGGGNEFCPANIFVPNTFTPNGDGTNDFWINRWVTTWPRRTGSSTGGAAFPDERGGDAWTVV